MNKFFYHIACILALFLISFTSKAQDTLTVSPSEISDTVYQTTSDQNGRFKEVTEVNKIAVRKVSQRELSRLRSDDDYWYVNEAPPREKKKPEPQKSVSVFDRAWFKVLFWVLLIGGFLALLIWFLSTGNIRLFQRKSKRVAEGHAEEEGTENIFELNFENEIQKAINVADYRAAVRLLYLRTLRDLSVNNLINYTHGKTNSDYLFQLAGSSYYKNFFRLTRDFDYTWYGHFPLSQEGFSVIQQEFNNFKQQLS